MPLVFDESRPKNPSFYIHEMTATALALVPNATVEQKAQIKAVEKALISAIAFQGNQIKLEEEKKYKKNLIEVKEQFSRQTRETTADMVKDHKAAIEKCQDLQLEVQLLELELSQERNLTTPVDESFNQFDFDPEKPQQSSAYLKVMRQLFKTPKQFAKNQGHWRRLEAAIIQATSHSIKAYEKEFSKRADGFREENEALHEELRKLSKYAGEYVRWQNQAEFYKADSINLTAQLKEAQEKIVLLEKEVQKGKKEADGQDSDTEKAVELKKLQQTIDRQKLMMEYKEKEQKAAVMYAELQITELQKELLRVRLCTEEK